MQETPISIIPKPVKCTQNSGTFRFTKATQIRSSSQVANIAHNFQQFIATVMGFTLPIDSSTSDQKKDECLILRIDETLQELGQEGYRFLSTPRKILITGKTPAGIFYGIQTLRQLLPFIIEGSQVSENIEWTIPCVEIEDYPRFDWRGYMLDESRNFIGFEYVKRILDMMALMKLDIFHWHLVDDQGWRLEIKKYPKLTEIGSKRTDTQLHGTKSKLFTGQPHEGFYTQVQIKEILAYAKDRFITVVPEIEMPGHCMASLATYPEYSCTGGPFEVPIRYGIKKDVYCAGKEATFQFLQDILDEVIELFQPEYLHIGGDEARDRWLACPDCQARMKTENLTEINQLQIYFTNRIHQYLTSKGIKVIGWNEIMGQQVTKDAICQWWVGYVGKMLPYIRQDWKYIMSKIGFMYFDFDHSLTPLKKLYGYDPIPRRLEAQYHHNILGIEATLWTEWISLTANAEWMTYPRLFALAEVGWTTKKIKNYNEFIHNVQILLKRLDLLHITYMKENLWNPSLFTRLWDLRKLPGGSTFDKYTH